MAILQKKKTAARNQASPVELLRDLGENVTNTVKSDLIGGVVNQTLDNLFSPAKANLQPNQEVVVASQEIIHPPMQDSEFRKPDVLLFTASEANLAKEVEAARAELKKAVGELKELNTAVLEVEKTLALTPVKAGRYHVSFFARLRTIIKLFRQQVSESRVWLEATVSKKKKKSYWGMFKKHGTSFSQSSELAIASQAG